MYYVGHRSLRREGRPKLKFSMEERNSSSSFAVRLLKELGTSFVNAMKSLSP